MKKTPKTIREDLHDRINEIVKILTPLTHKERDAVLIELADYRSHWFSRPVVAEAFNLAKALRRVQ